MGAIKELSDRLTNDLVIGKRAPWCVHNIYETFSSFFSDVSWSKEGSVMQSGGLAACGWAELWGSAAVAVKRNSQNLCQWSATERHISSKKENGKSWGFGEVWLESRS